ncbi:Gti1/Pac2 family-domain-containing protein [Cubamyces menziesii]|nr:Gti1/Pac2 family-domain-containing protein [Cubamyces menziesii]
MSGHDSQNNGQWTEPPWSGWIETTGDALLILEAARRGLIPRVTRRLVDSERKMITSGSVFVFDEDESGIKRWTDGFFWSPSRILGNFLLYRETEKRGAGHSRARAETTTNEEADGMKQEGQSLSRPKSESSRLGIDRQRERILVGSLTNSYKFKPGGMMKKTFSLTIGGVAQHLISYYKIEDVEQGRLRSPSSLPELASLTISPEYLDKTHFRNPPKVEIGVDGIPRYRGEADDVDLSPRLLPAPLSGSGYYGDADASSSKRSSKRYDPYGQGANPPKRPRKKNNSASSQQEATGADPQPQPLAVSVHQPQPAYADPNVPHYPAYGYYPVYSPAPYPPLPAPATTTPPHDSPSPPGASSASASTTTSPLYPPYYAGAPPQPHGYATYPPVSWPPYGAYPPPAATQPSGTGIQEITESDIRGSGGGGGGGAGA